MDRRSAIQRLGVLLGAALSTPTVSALLSGCQTPSADYAPQALTPEQFRWLGQLADIIIPRTDTPGALDAGVDRFVDVMLAEFYPASETEAFQAAMPGLMYELSPELDAVALFDRAAFQEGEPPRDHGDPFSGRQLYLRIREMVITGYYTSEPGASQELRVIPMGPWKGDVPYAELGRAWA